MQIRCSWNDPQTNKRYEPILNLPVAFGRNLATMKQAKLGTFPRMVITHNNINNYHCLIELENNQLVVKDQNSITGTFVNNIKQQKAVLNDGDILKIGEVEITINIMAVPLNMTYSPHPPTHSPTGEGENSYIPKPVKINFYNANGQQQNRILSPPIALGKDAMTMLDEKTKSNSNIASFQEIKDNSLNDYHALFSIENYQLVVIDKNSKHGTFVNGIQQQKSILQNGDNLRLGNVKGTIIITQNEMIIDIHNTQNQQPKTKPKTKNKIKTQKPQLSKPQIIIKFYAANGRQISNILTPPIALGSKLSDMISNIKNDIASVEINHDSISPYHALIDVEHGRLVIKNPNNNANNQKYQISLSQNTNNLALGTTVKANITINKNEMIIDIDNIEPPITRIKCAKCETIYENISRNAICRKCGCSLADGQTVIGQAKIIEVKVNSNQT